MVLLGILIFVVALIFSDYVGSCRNCCGKRTSPKTESTLRREASGRCWRRRGRSCYATLERCKVSIVFRRREVVPVVVSGAEPAPWSNFLCRKRKIVDPPVARGEEELRRGPVAEDYLANEGAHLGDSGICQLQVYHSTHDLPLQRLDSNPLSSALSRRAIYSSCPKATKRNPKQKRPIVAWTGSPNISAATTHPSPREQVPSTGLLSTWLLSAVSLRLTVNLHLHKHVRYQHLSQQLQLLLILKLIIYTIDSNFPSTDATKYHHSRLGLPLLSGHMRQSDRTADRVAFTTNLSTNFLTAYRC
ncbi:hypothetical protein EDB80DRAFT_832773 [Ilyonectria destructans]|nr:hypothetical protein EDB80DRAFT_832773 [Ilyonectria destructans]